MSKDYKDYKNNLQKRLNLKNVNAIPTIESVIINMGIGSIVTRK
jgi:ribosomal protein L5